MLQTVSLTPGNICPLVPHKMPFLTFILAKHECERLIMDRWTDEEEKGGNMESLEQYATCYSMQKKKNPLA